MSDETSSTSASQVSVFDPKDPNSPVFTVNMSNVTKLTNVNYIAWSQQIRFLLEGHGLQPFIAVDAEVPTAVITEAGLTKPNPAYVHWKRQDRLIHAAILGALSTGSQPLISCAQSSLEAWTTLEKTYGLPTRGHIKNIKNQLKDAQKGSKSIDEYMRTIRTKADELALLGKPLDHEDLLDYILAGLPEEYKSIVDTANGRETPMSFVELHEKLLNHEADLLRLGRGTQNFPVTANVVSPKPRPSTGHTHWKPPPPSHQGHRDTQRHPRPYLGRCQLCGVQGHSAKFCTLLQQFSGQQLTVSPRPVSQPPQWRSPRANPTFFAQSDPDAWLVDSGASHHVTSDLNTLAFHSPYTGNDSVIIGDGNGLPITHSGEGSTHGGATSNRTS